MTDRINALTVVLETDMRDDDAEGLISAIKQLRGVLTVESNVRNMNDLVAQERARDEMRQKLIDILYPPK